MKPMDAAKYLNIGRSTVRKWSIEFKDFFSPTAVGGDNQRRDITMHDLRLLKEIKRLTDRSTPRPRIIEHLRALQADDWRTLPALDEKDAEDELIDPEQLIPIAQVQAVTLIERQSMMREINNLEATIRGLKDELAAARGDKDSLMRELINLNGQLQRALALVELYEQGRIKPA